MHVIEKGDTIKLHVGHQSRYTRHIHGTVVEYCAEYIRIDVKSPPKLDIVTIANGDAFNESLTVYRGYSWVRMGSVDTLIIFKRSVANDNRPIQMIAGAYYDNEISFEQLKSLVGIKEAANFWVLKRQLSESHTKELAEL